MGSASRKLDKTLVLVGLMGCGKSSVGRRLAQRLGVGFVDTDDEIVLAAGAEMERTATSVWLRADLDTLWGRVKGKPGRPLLEQGNPKQVLADLMAARYPIYGMADIVVDSRANNSHDTVVSEILSGLADFEARKSEEK